MQPLRHQLNATASGAARHLSLGATRIGHVSRGQRSLASTPDLGVKGGVQLTRSSHHHPRWQCDHSGPAALNADALWRDPVCVCVCVCVCEM